MFNAHLFPALTRLFHLPLQRGINGREMEDPRNQDL
jgi:hypothetical protein